VRSAFIVAWFLSSAYQPETLGSEREARKRSVRGNRTSGSWLEKLARRKEAQRDSSGTGALARPDACWRRKETWDFTAGSWARRPSFARTLSSGGTLENIAGLREALKARSSVMGILRLVWGCAVSVN